MKHPLDIAREIYAQRGNDFIQDLGFCHRRGYVVSTPERFMMFYPIKLNAPNVPRGTKEADAWYIHLAVGKNCLKWFAEQLPAKLPFIVWARDFKKSGIPHIWPTEMVFKKVGCHHG